MEDAHEIPIDGILDLHTFRPAEVKDLVPEYLRACREKGILDVRVIHGKGTGTLRATVRAILERSPEVASFGPAPVEAGGWGATVVRLKAKAGPRGASMRARWTKTDDVLVHDARIFRLRRAAYRRDGGSGRDPEVRSYHYFDSADWANVIPLTPDRKVVLIRQFRIGIGDIVLETPGGMVDPGDAAPLDAAKRELLEETGYGSDDLEPIGHSHPNPATQNNTIWFFVARGVRKLGGQSLDPGEDIETELVDLKDIDRLIESGEITHALVLNAFDFLRRKHPEYWRP
jgi:ADP-ribose pyrophosphatase